MYSKNKDKISCKDILFSKRMRKWAFWFIVAFLAALTIKDVISLVILQKLNTNLILKKFRY